MIQIHSQLCIGCGRCADDCVARNISVRSGKASPDGDCFYCGHCVAICPQNAVSIPEYDMDDIGEYDEKQYHVSPEILLNMIKFRRSIRSYKNQALRDEDIQTLIQAGRYTATAGNRQDCRFVFVQDRLEELKELTWNGIGNELSLPDSPLEELRNMYLAKKNNAMNDTLFFNAPAVLVVASKISENAVLAAQNIELMAHAMGLGVLYNGYLNLALSSISGADTWLHTHGRSIAITMLLGYPEVQYVRTAPRRAADVIRL